jgi:multidrug transporter EmrE-like cation transporter
LSKEPESAVDPTDAPAAPRKARMSAATMLLLLFAVGSAASGQLLLKYGMQGAADKVKAGHASSLPVAAAASPWVLVGLGVFGVSALAWLTTLTRLPLNIAYPFNALGFLAILGASVLVLHERANLWTWLGTSLVVTGLVIVVTTKP